MHKAVLLIVMIGLLLVENAEAFRNEIPLKELAAQRTAEDFLELFAIGEFDRGRADCGRRISPSTRRCKLEWDPGRTSGTARITAFISKKNHLRSASIRYRLVKRYSTCPVGKTHKGCTAFTQGEVIFRLRSGSK